MKTTQNIFGLVASVLVLICTSGCITKTNVTTKGSSPRVVPGTTNVVYETFEHTDRSLRVVQPDWSGGGGGGIVRFHATVGGAPIGQYGYGSVPGSYGYGAGGVNSGHGYYYGGTYVQGLSGPAPVNGWPTTTVPIESQDAYQRQTWERYFGHSSSSTAGSGEGGYSY